MSDEEKESIEWLKRLVKINKRDNLDDTFAEILLNLIEKQQKEIEELKDTKKELTERVLRLESDKFWDNVVSKDKIKAKIEELYETKQYWTEEVKKILQSLLEKE